MSKRTHFYLLFLVKNVQKIEHRFYRINVFLSLIKPSAKSLWSQYKINVNLGEKDTRKDT